MGGLRRKEKERTRFPLVSFVTNEKGFFLQKLRANAPDRLVCMCVDVHTVNIWGLTVGSVVGLNWDWTLLLAHICRARYLVLHLSCICAEILYD